MFLLRRYADWLGDRVARNRYAVIRWKLFARCLSTCSTSKTMVTFPITRVDRCSSTLGRSTLRLWRGQRRRSTNCSRKMTGVQFRAGIYSLSTIVRACVESAALRRRERACSYRKRRPRDPACGGRLRVLRRERADELPQADGITSADFAAPDHRSVDPNVGLVMLGRST